MTITFLQLNIQKGRRLETVIDYIRKNDVDIACLQEVAGGRLAHRGRNCYEALVSETRMAGQLAITATIKGDVSSFIGNTTLFRSHWRLVASRVIWLKRYQEVTSPVSVDPSVIARSALATLLTHNNKKVLVVNTHLAWGPTSRDTLYKRNQADKLYQWMKKERKHPFILAGDFNLNPRTAIVSRMSTLGVNLTKKYRITNTLNPRTHYAKNLFPSGLPVDYVITDRRIKVKKFLVEERVDLSDHYGLVAEVTL